MMSVVKNWNRLSKEVVGAPCLEAAKVKLGEALSNLSYWKGVPAHCRGVGLDEL